MDNEAVNLPIPAAGSFRESVRKSLRKLRRNKKKRDTKRRKEDESIYEVTESVYKTDKEHDDVYEVIKTNDTEYSIDNEDDRVVIEDERRKPSVQDKKENQNSSLAVEVCGEAQEDSERSSTPPGLEDNINDYDISVRDEELEENNTSSLGDRTAELIPRGPLGDLMKRKQSQNTVNTTVIIHREVEDEEIPERNIDFKVEHIDVDRVDESEAENEEIGWSVGRQLTSAVVIHPRQGNSRTELDLKDGDIVFLQRRLDSDWYLGQKKGVGGLIPAAYVQ